MDKELLEIIYTNEPDYNILAGGTRLVDDINFSISKPHTWHFNGYEIDKISDVISQSDCENLIYLFTKNGHYVPVTIQGLQEVTSDSIGSERITAFAPKIADRIYSKIKDSLPKEKICSLNTLTDWWQESSTNSYEFVGVSPMLRFMKYEKGDVWDNKNDEDMIGASYDDLELYLGIKKSFDEMIQYSSIKKFYIDSDIPNNINEIRNKNKHKTLVGLPCHVLNII